jgi:predicted transcriptional regulator
MTVIALGSATDILGRSRTEVITILEAANNGRATITKIMRRALHSISKDYLTLPVEHDLLAQEKGKQL